MGRPIRPPLPPTPQYAYPVKSAMDIYTNDLLDAIGNREQHASSMIAEYTKQNAGEFAGLSRDEIRDRIEELELDAHRVAAELFPYPVRPDYTPPE